MFNSLYIIRIHSATLKLNSIRRYVSPFTVDRLLILLAQRWYPPFRCS